MGIATPSPIIAPRPDAAALQRLAMNPDHSAWVSASAGSGKTYVLIHRVITLLLQGASPDSILCLTYTKAAAAEMQERIFARLRTWLTLDDAALRRDIQKFTDHPVDLGKARRLFAELLEHPIGLKIQTIHAFCQSLLGQFPLEAGLQPNFKILEDSSAQELRTLALKATYAAALEGNTDVRQALSVLAALNTDKSISNLLGDILGDSLKIDACFADFPTKADYRAALSTLIMSERSLDEQAFMTAVACPPEAVRIATIAANVGNEGSTEKDGAFYSVADWLAQPLSERSRTIKERYALFFLTLKHTPRKTIITKKNPNLVEHDYEILHQEAERLAALYAARDVSRIFETSEALYTLLHAVHEQYGRLKNSHGLYDYADLIARALALVTDSESAAWVLYKLDQRLEHLLLDEAQDTSAPQWAIVEQLTADFFAGESVTEKDPSLFVVGDFKQSIYSFQGANPALFQENEQYYAEMVTTAQKGWERVPLDVSFRSSQPILDFVDSVFHSDAARNALGVNGIDGIDIPLKHTAHRQHQAGHIALLPLATGTQAQTPDWPLPLQRAEQTDADDVLAQSLADMIGAWLDTKRLLPSRHRPVEPRDILLLVRTRSALSHRIIATFKKRGIPIAGADRFSLKNHLAIQDLLALGNFLLLPEDAYSLACVLKSPLFNVSEQALFDLCHARQGSLWQVVREQSPFGETLSHWLGQVDFLTPVQLYGQILQAARPAFRARFGEEVVDVLEEFDNVLFTFEEQHIPTLQGFLHWADNAPLTVKRELGNTHANEIRIMTVHGAKGLQAPIVFLLDANSTPRARERLIWANTLFVAPQGATVLPETLRGLKELRTAETTAEYHRLLYVALTRAEDELYIAGRASGYKEPMATGSWYDLAAHVFAGNPLTQTRPDGTLYWDTPLIGTPDRVEQRGLDAADTMPLPAWAQVPVDVEIPRAAVVSREAQSAVATQGMGMDSIAANAARERGIVLHSYLQKLPLLPQEKQEQYLNIAANLQEADKALLRGLLAHPDLHAVFKEGRLTEVRVRAVLDNKLYQGQIDCLIIGAEDILLVDYKSTSSPPVAVEDVPKAYLQQLALYAASVRALYPNHTLACALLWTETGMLMRIPRF
jgi:ATP-dependent helicase/nuclease subunit A